MTWHITSIKNNLYEANEVILFNSLIIIYSMHKPSTNLQVSRSSHH